MNRLTFILFSLALLLTMSPSANADKKSTKTKASLQKEIDLLNSQLKANAKDRSKAQDNLNLIQRKITKRKALIEEGEREIRTLGDSIASCENHIAVLQRRYDTLDLYYGRLVKNAYKNRDSRLWYMYILSSEDISQGFRRFAYLRSFSREMSSQAEKIVRTQAEIDARKKELSSLRDQASTLRDRRLEDVSKLKDEETDANKLIDQLKNDRARYLKELDRKKKEMAELKRKTDAIIKKNAAESKRKATTEVDAKLSSSFASNKGKLPWPVDGSVTGSFGEHPHPVYKNVMLPFNNGVNVTVAKNSAVKAVFDGTVVSIHVMPGYNQCVLVQHGSYYTLYCRMKSVSVKEGAPVKTGHVLGVVDTIDGEDMLHFELWKNQSPQDPEDWLR